MTAKPSSLNESPANEVEVRSHVEALPSAFPRIGKAARKSLKEANDFDDLDTADLLTEVSRGIDEWLWFVKAHVQPER
jgi:starvation-inducible DNA-binding protein